MFYALKAFVKQMDINSVVILSDYTMVVAHLNKMGGTKSPSLVALMKEVWTWCLERHLEIRAQYLPGKKNIKADFLLRHLRDRTDWVLNPEFFGH